MGVLSVLWGDILVPPGLDPCCQARPQSVSLERGRVGVRFSQRGFVAGVLVRIP